MPGRTVIPISAHPQVGKISEAEYFRLYEQSLADPERFWAEHGKRIDWMKPFTKVRNAAFEGDVHIAWYEDGTLNASHNCIDRHLPRRAEQTAILWEGDDPSEDRRVTYRELHEAVCRLANVTERSGCPERRPGHDLSPDDPRGRVCDARLRPHRRRSIPSSSAVSRPTASSGGFGIAARPC